MSRKERDRDHNNCIEFYAYRSELARLLEKLNNVIENTGDFWAFVQKYEQVERKKSRTNVPQQRPSNSGNLIQNSVL